MILLRCQDIVDEDISRFFLSLVMVAGFILQEVQENLADAFLPYECKNPLLFRCDFGQRIIPQVSPSFFGMYQADFLQVIKVVFELSGA